MLGALRHLNQLGASTAAVSASLCKQARTKATASFGLGSGCGTSARAPCRAGSARTSPPCGGGQARSATTSSAESKAGAKAGGEGAKSAFDGVDLNKAAGAAEAAAEGTEKAGGGTSIFAMALLGLCGTAGVVGYAFEGKDVHKMADKAEGQAPEPLVSLARSYATWREGMEDNVRQFSEPSSEKLLPDLPPPAAQYMRTLVLDLDETLVHSDWRRERGWRTFKRPGVEEFLRHMSQFYEIVVYTGQLSTYGEPIMERLDPDRYVPYRLYRDATLYEDGKHLRDLKRLNRDLKRVLYVTSDAKNCTSAPNAIEIKPWRMEADDTTLLDLMPFLEMIVRSQLPDVRQVVESYRGTDIPSEFRARTAEMKKNLRQKSGGNRFFGSGPR